MSKSDGQYQESDQRGTESKTEATITALGKLLTSGPAAEELSRVWQRSKGQTVQDDGPRLHDLRRVIDSGQVLKKNGSESRGVPMWIVVRMCKATWHQDGTWPLLGADENISEVLATTSLIRSIHPSSELLRPKGITCFQLPPDEVERGGSKQMIEASAEEIAAAYRKRGIQVEEIVCNDLEEW